MAATGRQSDTPVADRLLREAHRFDFFQAVRLFDRIVPDGAPREARTPVGHDSDPEREAVRFRSNITLQFPATHIAEVRRAERDSSDAMAPPPEMLVNFLGLAGPSGVLPQHYTVLLLDLIRKKEFALRDFIDLFNHRLVSLFYRAWEKYRLPIAYQSSRIHGVDRPGRDRDDPDDEFTAALFAIVGLRTKGLRQRTAIDDEVMLYYAGLFADRRRSAVALERMLESYFGLPARVDQFRGRWLALPADDCSRLSGDPSERPNTGLGSTLLLGSRIWDVQGKFRIRLGPLSVDDFRRLLPIGDGIKPLRDLVRTFVGPEFDFDLQLVLKAEDAPPFELVPHGPRQARLGWTSWICAEQPKSDLEDVCFDFADA